MSISLQLEILIDHSLA